ncbi:caspase family protein [Gracilimonas sediminicola]|uniref:Caspase family protein n=1 Tax=Gracilimonas sediminicola TaxID=2952158 RepID=A0A9X2L234_9BACT|nr:caspase family protein [Gracilimonas sediminicola]
MSTNKPLNISLLLFTVLVFSACSSVGVLSSENEYLPKASDDASIVFQLNSNVPRTTFYVDGKEVVTAERAKILVNGNAHTITASPEGYRSKEEYLQPPYDKTNYLRFTFMIGDKLNTDDDTSDPILADRQRKPDQAAVEKQTPVDIEFDIPKANKINTDAVGVIIGNKDYSKDIPNVDYAVNDAALVKEYFINTLGIKPGNIIYEENAGKATFDAIFGNENNHMGKLHNFVKPGKSDVYIFYSGHGSPDVNSNSAYMMPIDSDPAFVSFSGYSTDLLYGNLSKLNAKSVAVFLDACFSGASGSGEMLIKNASPIGIKVKNKALTIDNSLIITASSGEQIASWYPHMRHGLFTYFLLKGFKGEADLDNDGILTKSELQNYLTDQDDGIPYFARRLHNRIQTPEIISNEYEETLIKYKN